MGAVSLLLGTQVLTSDFLSMPRRAVPAREAARAMKLAGGAGITFLPLLPFFSFSPALFLPCLSNISNSKEKLQEQYKELLSALFSNSPQCLCFAPSKNFLCKYLQLHRSVCTHLYVFFLE